MGDLQVDQNYLSNIISELEIDIQKIKVDGKYLNNTDAKIKLNEILSWLRSTPKNVTFRVNTLQCRPDNFCCIVENVFKERSQPVPSILTFPHLPEMVIVNAWDNSVKLDLEMKPKEIIVDAICGAAILRGSHIFAPGVLGMPRGLNFGDKVSVFIDETQGCKKGLIKKYNNANKIFVGNGIVHMGREEIFHHEKNSRGIAILMTDVVSRLPQLNNSIVPSGWAMLQNLPSIVCSRILNPQPGETVLDMCAAPGNKTTHISALMSSKGVVIAVDKLERKVRHLKENCKNFEATNVQAYCFDSMKAVCEDIEKSVTDGPPFSKCSFDRILLDGPCSALGQRPLITHSITVAQLRSYVALQRKLFSTAVDLLKFGGTLVYSTCTITVAENEGIVAWALNTFPCLKLDSIKEKFQKLNIENYGTCGYNVDGLTTEQSNCLRRFGPESDTIGFFIAAFKKIKN